MCIRVIYIKRTKTTQQNQKREDLYMKRLFGNKLACFLGGILLFTMVSCNQPANNHKPVNPDSDIPTIDFDESDYVSHGTAGGYLIDIGANSLLSENNDYLCTFVPSTSTDGYIRLVSTREESVTLTLKGEGQAEFTINAHEPGDSIIKIYDSNDILVYRNIVRIRKAYSETEIINACYENDVFKGLKMLGNHRMTFLDNATVATAQLKGNDDYEKNINISFSCTYSQYIQEIDSYEFTCEVTDNPNNSQTKITVLFISRTASEIKMYYRSGSDDVLFNIFYASKYEFLHEGMLY